MPQHDDPPRPAGMLVDIVIAAAAALPSLGSEPPDNFSSVGLKARLQDGTSMRKYMRIRGSGQPARRVIFTV